MAEDKVKELLLRENKPFNVQTITDCLAQFGVKKGQVQKAVDNLAAENTIICKEFGKQKLFFASQADTQDISSEELAEKTRRQAELQSQVSERAESAKSLKTELQALRDCLSLEKIEKRTKELQAEVLADEQNLTRLQTGTEVISAEDRQRVAKDFANFMDHWKKRRRIFKQIWGDVSENIDRKEADVFEELGVECDDADEFRRLSELLPGSKRQRI